MKKVIITAALLTALFSTASSQTSVYVGKKCPECVQIPHSFTTAYSTKKTERTIWMTPNYKAGEEKTVIPFRQNEDAEMPIIAGSYDVALPELSVGEKLTIRLMFDQFIIKEWIIRDGDDLTFAIDLLQNQKLSFTIGSED